MGKGKKRKNPGVGVDFRKVKHKVGKKLPKAQNETKTDFQSRSINLPTQSVAQDKAGTAVSERNLTLKELVTQLSHHNTHTRRDALSGLQQLITAHPTEATRHAALLLEALVTRVSDGEQPVRTALLSVLRMAALPAVGPAVLSPFLPVFMAHLSAALTHLSADVRLDALAVLEALTEAAPQLMSADQQLQAALAHYIGLASRSNRGTSVKSQALSGLLKVLSSLERFLTAALGTAAAGSRDGAVSKGDSYTAAAADLADGPLLGFRAAPPNPATLTLPAAAELLRLYVVSNSNPAPRRQQQQQQPAAGAASTSAVGQTAVSLQQQTLQLLSVLFDCWSEAAPASLSVVPEQESASALVHILACTQLLLAHLGPLGQAPLTPAAAVKGSSGCPCPGFDTDRDKSVWLNQAAAAVLPKLLQVFPVSAPAAPVSAQVRELLQQFNLLSVQVLTGFVSAGVLWPPGMTNNRAASSAAGSGDSMTGSRSMGSTSSSGGISKAEMAEQQGWQDRLLTFMADVLVVGHCLPTSDQDTSAPLPAPTTSGSKQHTGGNDTAATAEGSAQQLRGAKTSNSSSSSILVVLQCLQQLLPQLPHQQRQQLLAAVNQLATPAAGSAAAAARNGGPVRVACLQLQLQLLLGYLYEAVPDPEQESGIAAWVAAAPKLLWECGSSKPQVSKLLLLLLYHASRLSLPGSLIQQQLVQVQQQLAPLFATALPAATGARKQSKADSTHPSAAASPAAAVPVLIGPLASLPTDVQSLAFDTLCFLLQLQQPLLRAVALCCRLSSYSDSAVLGMLDAVLAAANRNIAPDQYISFVATLLSASPAGGYIDRSTGQGLTAGYTRHESVTDAVCCWLHTYGPLPELVSLLLPVLLEQFQQQQQQLAVAGSHDSGVDGVRCSSYSCIGLVTLAAGCWTAPSSRAALSTASRTGSRTASSCVAAEAELLLSLPEAVLQQLPAVMAAYCASSVAAVEAAAAVDGSAETAAAAAGSRISQTIAVTPATVVNNNASPEVVLAVVDKCLSLIMPLVVAAPDRLLMSFVQTLLEAVLGCDGVDDASEGTSTAAATAIADNLQLQLDSGAAIAVVVHVINAVLECQSLRGFVMHAKQLMQQIVGRVVAAAEVLQQQTGDAAVVSSVQKLPSAISLLCGQ